MTVFLHPGVLLIWIAASSLIGLLGMNKRFGFVGNFLISFVFSPVVGIIVLLASEPQVSRRSKRS